TTCCTVVFSCFFFFFQAEDGIRDDLVTGVQTCALPIYAIAAALTILFLAVDPHGDAEMVNLLKGDILATTRTSLTLLAYVLGAEIGRARVGKEWRARASPYSTKERYMK